MPHVVLWHNKILLAIAYLWKVTFFAKHEDLCPR